MGKTANVRKMWVCATMQEKDFFGDRNSAAAGTLLCNDGHTCRIKTRLT